MRFVIDAPISQRQIPTELALRVVQLPAIGTRITASIQMDRGVLSFEPVDGKRVADVDIGGIFYDDKGKPASSFVGRLRIYSVPENLASAKPSQAVYEFQAWLTPGLYQVRVGVRDIKSGRIGSAMQWIEIPSLAAH